MKKTVFAVLLSGVCVAAPALSQDAPALTNWPAPPYWSPTASGGLQAPGPLTEPEDRHGTRQALALPSSPLPFVAIPPCRLADTRDGTFPAGYGPPSLPAALIRDFVFTGRCGIASTAQAVSTSLAVTNTLGPGFIVTYPAGGSPPNPLVSSVNYIAGQTVANAAIVPLGTGGAATFAAGVSGTDLIIDVNGYYDGTGMATQGAATNPLQIALLRWYPANQGGATFNVGLFPYAVAFDGANIWVANAGTNNVTKLRASDGANLGTFSVGSYPIGVAFDGANIWVANGGSSSVTKL
jgi:hypothetical protein